MAHLRRLGELTLGDTGRDIFVREDQARAGSDELVGLIAEHRPDAFVPRLDHPVGVGAEDGVVPHVRHEELVLLLTPIHPLGHGTWRSSWIVCGWNTRSLWIGRRHAFAACKSDTAMTLAAHPPAGAPMS
jgi:hypothetical protein